MKVCKSCKEPIAEKATKCPNCQSFQSWYRNPVWLALSPLLLLTVALILFPSRRDRVKFEEFAEQIKLQQLSQDTIMKKDLKRVNLLIDIKNESDKNWGHAAFEVRYLSSTGKLLNIEKTKDFNLILKAKSTTQSSIKLPVYPEYSDAKLEVKLVDLTETLHY